MTVPDVETLVLRRQQLVERIEAAGGDPETVEIVAVTKRFPVEAVERAMAAGFCSIGENYAQELIAKARSFDERNTASGDRPRWHMIGGLQRNKIKKLVGITPIIQTLDRPELIAEVASRLPGATVFVQVNTTAEPQKSGCSIADAPGLIEACREHQLELEGLMTIGPTDGSDPTPSFVRLRELADEHDISQCSMGMTADLEAAVAAGSTMIRVGSALFGPRPTTI